MKSHRLIIAVLLLFGCVIPNALFSESMQYGVCSAKPLESQVIKDLWGQVIKDPSPNSYFPDGWSWTIKRGDIEYLTFINETVKPTYYVALVTIHLKRYQMPVDAKVVLTYMYNNNTWQLTNLQMSSLTFPSQRNYSSCVQIYMDYDFMPALVVKNTCGCLLFIAGAYGDNGKQQRFAVELDPNEESTIAIGPAPEKYSIHFAYRE